MAIAEETGMVQAQHYTRERTSLTTMTAGDVETTRLQAQVIAASEMMAGKGVRNQEEAVANAAIKLFAAQELGVPPVLASAGSGLYIIEGRLSLGAHLRNGLMRRAGIKVRPIERTTERATIRMTRPDDEPFEYTVTMEECVKRGITKDRNGDTKKNWRESAAYMLYAAAVRDASNIYAPDVTLGMPGPEDFGYTDEDAADAPAIDQDAPLGKAWADAFVAEVRKLPNPVAVRDDLEAKKKERYESAAYKLQAVPRRDEQFWQEWLESKRAESGERVGQKQADAVWERVPKIAAKAGVPEGEITAHIKQQVTDWRLGTLADCNAAQMEEIAGYLLSLTEKPVEDGVTEADFTPAAEPEYDDDPFPETRTDAPGSATRLRPA